MGMSLDKWHTEHLYRARLVESAQDMVAATAVMNHFNFSSNSVLITLE